MNKSNINEQSAKTEADNDSTAENPSVSRFFANTNVMRRFFQGSNYKLKIEKI